MPEKQPDPLSLSGKVAIVTGASRGVGKGIAMALGEAGATVYVTGRTLKSSDASVPLPGTLISTAKEVTRLGGKGIPKDKLPYTESPMYVGRAAAALAADPKKIKKTGRILLAGEMAKEYGFEDIDGTCPIPLHLTKTGKQVNKAAFERLRKAIE